MNEEIAVELKRFESFRKASYSSLDISDICDYGIGILPNNYREPKSNFKKRFDLTILAMMHGNEPGGLASINRFMQQLSENRLELNLSLAVVLGNPLASKQNKRYIECDLNRAFTINNNDRYEDARADIIKKILISSHYMIDLHQTMLPTYTPFLISSSPHAARFASFISLNTPVVIYSHHPFHRDGVCSDEYINMVGGCGLTVEIGEVGLGRASIDFGEKLIIRTMKYLESQEEYLDDLGERAPSVFGFEQAIISDGKSRLDPGWNNFSKVEKGQRLGSSCQVDLLAPCDGRMIFPLYPKAGHATNGIEICHILRETSIDNFFSDSRMRGAG